MKIIDYLQHILQNESIYNICWTIIYIIILCCASYILNKIFIIIDKKIKKNKQNNWFILILSFEKSLKIFLICLVFLQILELFNSGLREIKIALKILTALFIASTFIEQYAKRFIEAKEERKENVDYGGIDFLKKISQILAFFIIILTGLGRLGINMQSLMAIGGIGGMAIGFAAKNVVGNIFGGLAIYLDKPFGVGDWISSPDREIEGIVEEIGWRQTRIMTFSKYPIYVANSIFGDIIVENKARMKSRRINEIIKIRYIDIEKVDTIIKQIREMLRNNSNINQRLRILVFLKQIDAGSYLDINIDTFANTIERARYVEIQQDVLLKAINIIKNNSAEVAYTINEIAFNDKNANDKKVILN